MFVSGEQTNNEKKKFARHQGHTVAVMEKFYEIHTSTHECGKVSKTLEKLHWLKDSSGYVKGTVSLF